jgi:hypothetical protein
MSFAATYPHYPTCTTSRSSQFDSPAFNNGPYRQPPFNSFPYHTPVAHTPRMNFPPTPQFQTQHFHPYSVPHSYRPLSNTQHHTHQPHQFNTDIGLDSGPFVVPSQHRDTLDTRPVGDAGSDIQYHTSYFPSRPMQ